MEGRYDLVILGSGSTAFAAALRAQELGKTAVMAEERVVGGTCANRGCLPSKNLIEAARLVYDASSPRYPGLRPCRIEVDFPSLIAQKDQIVLDYRQKKYDSLIGDRIHIEVQESREAFLLRGVSHRLLKVHCLSRGIMSHLMYLRYPLSA